MLDYLLVATPEVMAVGGSSGKSYASNRFIFPLMSHETASRRALAGITHTGC